MQNVQFTILVVAQLLPCCSIAPQSGRRPAQTLLQQDRVSIFPAQMKFHSQVWGVLFVGEGVMNAGGKLRPGRRQQDEGGFRHRMKIVKLALILPLLFQGKERVC